MNRFQRACGAGTEECRSRSTMRERAAAQNAQGNSLNEMPLAMAYVPIQCFERLYEPMDGWHRGTIFADLDKPYEGGCCR